ncbi:MAG: alanine--tRNA ligase, partial [Deltaproteobacteria bacterium]
MTGNQLRRIFLEYFEKHGHRIVRSAPLVPRDDPTLLFVNAGMVQFKRVFMGEEKRNYVTAASCQKCVRAGGKHNDLDNVGYTARHHTFFEMLGNFSFGDYFKERAIELAWDLLLNGYGLPEDRLSVSVFHDDEEAFRIWNEKIGLPAERIFRLDEKDNFWSMGDTGPCGPCSEIYIDRGEDHGCGKAGCAVGCDCDRFLEIWNMVFMQFNRKASGEMEPLPKPSIDTGMGLERLCSIVQNTRTNYETDLFSPVIAGIEAASGRRYGEDPDVDVCMKVIADHSRAAAFLVGDGVLPSNEGRGYVLRRIMRRAIRYGRYIGLTESFLPEIAGAVLDVMHEPYPELKDAEAFITTVIANEESRFSETLDNGLKLLNDTIDKLLEDGGSVIPGDVIFKLYDTYGFPVDIVRDVARERNIDIDMEGFRAKMEDQKARSRAVADFSSSPDAYKRLSAKGVKTVFVGYDSLTAEGRLLAVVSNGHEVEQAATGQEVELVSDITPFYAESGGQVGDTGLIRGDGFEVRVVDTVKDPAGLVIHKGVVESGEVKRGAVILEVNSENRTATALNHTATHLLHAALREIVGDHVKQAGSMVSPERLRFDFTHFSMVDRETLDKIETFVNDRIRENRIVSVREMGMDDARKEGAIALFEEKYGDTVRVVTIEEVSKELCGGTHTDRTGNIGLFVILSEAGIASGVRRIEAVTGRAAVEFVQKNLRVLNEAAGVLKESPSNLPERISRMVADAKAKEKEISSLRMKLAAASVDGGGGDPGHRVIN